MGRLDKILRSGVSRTIDGLPPELRLIASAAMRETTSSTKLAVDHVLEHRGRLYESSIPELVWSLSRLSYQNPALLLAKEANRRPSERLQYPLQAYCISKSLQSCGIDSSKAPKRFKSPNSAFIQNMWKTLSSKDPESLRKTLDTLVSGRYAVFSLPCRVITSIFVHCAKVHMNHEVLNKLLLCVRYKKDVGIPQVIWSLGKLNRKDDVVMLFRSMSDSCFSKPQEVTMVAWALKHVEAADRKSSSRLSKFLSEKMTPKMIAFSAWSLSDCVRAQEFVSNFFIRRYKLRPSHLLTETELCILLRRVSNWEPSDRKDMLLNCLSEVIDTLKLSGNTKPAVLSDIIRGLNGTQNYELLVETVGLYVEQLKSMKASDEASSVERNYLLDVDLSGVLQSVSRMVVRLRKQPQPKTAELAAVQATLTGAVETASKELFTIADRLINGFLEKLEDQPRESTIPPFAIQFFTYCVWSFAKFKAVKPSFIVPLNSLYYNHFESPPDSDAYVRMIPLYMFCLKELGGEVQMLAASFVQRSIKFLLKRGFHGLNFVDLTMCVSSSRRILLPAEELTPEVKLLCVEYIAQKGFLKTGTEIDSAAVSSVLFDLNCNKVSQWVSHITETHGLAGFNGRSLATMAYSHSNANRTAIKFWKQLDEVVASRSSVIELDLLGCICLVKAFEQIGRPLSRQLASLIAASLSKLSLKGLPSSDAARIVTALATSPCSKNLFVRLGKAIEADAASLPRHTIPKVTRAFVNKKVVTPELFSALRKSMSNRAESRTKNAAAEKSFFTATILDSAEHRIAPMVSRFVS